MKRLLNFIKPKNAPKLLAKITETGLNLATGGVAGTVKDLILGSDELSDHEKEMALLELQQDHEQALALIEDRQNAREMNTQAMANQDKFIRRFPAYLALVLVFTVIIITGLLVFVELPDSNESIVFSIVGALITVLAGVGGFYYGSSEGSKHKDQQLNTLMKSIKP
ncbi:MAG: hypothetical protein AAFW89_12935 [Bacteroidota bacterium]